MPKRRCGASAEAARTSGDANGRRGATAGHGPVTGHRRRARGWRRLWGGAAAGGRHGEAEGEGGRMEREMTCETCSKGILVFLPFCLSYPVRKYNF